MIDGSISSIIPEGEFLTFSPPGDLLAMGLPLDQVRAQLHWRFSLTTFCSVIWTCAFLHWTVKRKAG